MATWPCTCTKYESGLREVELTCKEHGDEARAQIQNRIVANKPRPWDQWCIEGTREDIESLLIHLGVGRGLWADHIAFITSQKIWEAWRDLALPHTVAPKPHSPEESDYGQG